MNEQELKELTERFRAIRDRSGFSECPECGWLVTDDVECNMCGAQL